MTIDSTLPLASAWGHQAMTQLVPLAKELDKNKVTPGVLGFIVFALLGAAAWLLMKNMNKQFGKIDFEERDSSGEGGEVPAARTDAGSGESAAAGRPAGADRPAAGSGD